MGSDDGDPGLKDVPADNGGPAEGNADAAASSDLPSPKRRRMNAVDERSTAFMSQPGGKKTAATKSANAKKAKAIPKSKLVDLKPALTARQRLIKRAFKGQRKF
jgi:hypothetical protein